MKTWRASIFGILGISALVAAAAWLPNHPECTRWPLTFLSPDGADGGPARLVAVHRVGWAGDGQMLFSISRGESGAEEYLTLHDTTRGNRAARIDAVGEPVVCGALSPDGLHLAVGTPARGLLWIDLKTRDEIVLAEPGRPQEFTAVAVAGDGGLIAAATTSGQIYLCTPGQRTSVILASPRESAISDVRFSRDGARLVSAQACGTVSVWLARTLGPAMSTSIVGIPVIKLKTTDLFILQRIASSLAPGHGSSRSGTRLLSVFSLVGFFVVARHITHAALASFASSRSELVL